MAKKKLTDLTGDGKITRKDFLRGAGVPGFSHGGDVPHRDPGQVERDMEAEAKEREKDEEVVKKILMPTERRGDDKAVKKFRHGGLACPGTSADRTAGARSAIRGTRYSGTY